MPGVTARSQAAGATEIYHASMRTIVLAAAGLATLFLGCSTNGSTPRPSSGSTAPTSSPSSATIAAEFRPFVEPVVADAAARMSVEPEQVAVVSIEATTWSDGALGCPKEGELYTQALVDGHRVVVSADGRTLDYRVTGPGAFRLCENPPAGQP